MVERFVSIEEAAGSMPAFSTFSKLFCSGPVCDLLNPTADAYSKLIPIRIREELGR